MANRLVVTLSLCLVGLACVRVGVQPSRDRLAARADSLIARVLETPGSFATGGDNVYAFITDQDAVDDLAALELHAVPQLIECMADDRPSRVRYGAGEMSLRGAVCFEMLVHTNFFQMRSDTLLRRASQSVGCDDCHFAGYQATAAELRAAQRVWRAYLDLYRTEGSRALPRLAQTAVGCYTMQLIPHSAADAAVVDSTRRIYFELDTLPLPATVRPARIELKDSVTAGGGRARWNAHYESQILVRWRSTDSSYGLSLIFGGSDSARASGYHLDNSSGTVRVMRAPCSR